MYPQNQQNTKNISMLNTIVTPVTSIIYNSIVLIINITSQKKT